MMWWGNGMGPWGYGIMVTSSLLFWVLIIVGIVALVRYLTHSGGDRPINAGAEDRSSAMQLLADRFAAGEIDENEYRQRRTVLTEHRRTGRRGQRP